MTASAARRASSPGSSPSHPNEPPSRGHIQVADDAYGAAASPARALQARLEQDFQAGDRTERRWPLYAALSFWIGVGALMWAAIIGCAWIVLRHI